jgi:beta-glucosidase
MAHRTYRYFKGQPLYAFGYGLSYTGFSYANLKLSTTHLHAGDPLTVEADVKNVGDRDGEEVAELYLMPPSTSVSPTLALAGFQRIRLQAGEMGHVSFVVDPRRLSQIDDRGTRAVTAGAYRVSVGGSQPDGQKTLQAGFTIDGEQQLPR